MTSLQIFGKRAVTFKGQKGEVVHTTMYQAWLPDGSPIEFSSSNEDWEANLTMKYTPKFAVELEIQPKLYKGELKWREDVKDNRS